MRLTSLLVVAAVACSWLGAATPTSAATPCYWSAEKEVGTRIDPGGIGAIFYSGVFYKIGYSCNGEPLVTKVSKVSVRATWSASGGNPRHEIGAFQIRQSKTAVAAWSGSGYNYCYGGCTTTKVAYSNVTIPYGSTNTFYFGCYSCPSNGLGAHVSVYHYYVTNRHEYLVYGGGSE